MPKTESKSQNNILNIGDTAPDFCLINQIGNKLHLYEELKSNKILLVFYPKDNTPGCTIQACGIRDSYQAYQKYGVKVIGINPGDEKSHKKFIEKYSLPFDILVDLEGEKKRPVAEIYGAIGSFMGHITTKRGVFLVSKNKSIIYQVWGQQNNQEIFDFLEGYKS